MGSVVKSIRQIHRLAGERYFQQSTINGASENREHQVSLPAQTRGFSVGTGRATSLLAAATVIAAPVEPRPWSMRPGSGQPTTEAA